MFRGMIVIAENMLWVLGSSVNFFLISKLLIRPVLWSTTNSFLGFILTLNFFYLLLQIFLVGQENEETNADDAIIQSLEHLFTDNYKSILCSAKYISDFIHGSSTLFFLVGIIFIRSMMIKHADNIRPDEIPCKSHQARLSIIGILVAVLTFTISIGGVIGITLHPLSPFDFLRVRNCRGVSISYPEDEMLKIIGHWLSRLVGLVLIALAILSCQVRIIYFKSHHNNSYFSHFRQNIATVDQTLAAAYIKICMSVIKEAIFYNPAIEVETFLKISIVLDCIIVPCYWIYSTKQDFREFWSNEMVFGRTLRKQKHVLTLQQNSDYNAGLEPRRPHSQETRFINERSQTLREGQLSGRFYYGFKMHKTRANRHI